jgi:hypothetical protein
VIALSTVSILSLAVKTKPQTRRSRHHPEGDRGTPLTALALCRTINQRRYACRAAYFERAAKALFVGLHGWSPLGFGHKKTPGDFSLRARCTALRGTLKSPPNQGGHKFGY